MKPRTRKWPRLLLTSLPYLVHSPEDRSAMLETLGVRAMNDLLVDIPQSLRLESLQLPNGLSEFETMAQVSSLAERNLFFFKQKTAYEINEVADKKQFQDAVKPVWDKYGAQHAALIQ